MLSDDDQSLPGAFQIIVPRHANNRTQFALRRVRHVNLTVTMAWWTTVIKEQPWRDDDDDGEHSSGTVRLGRPFQVRHGFIDRSSHTRKTNSPNDVDRRGGGVLLQQQQWCSVGCSLLWQLAPTKLPSSKS